MQRFMIHEIERKANSLLETIHVLFRMFDIYFTEFLLIAYCFNSV